VASKPGLVMLWAPYPNGLSWSGQRTLRIQPQKISVGSSPLHSVSGVHYVPDQDTLIICLVDGSFHTVFSISSDPSWTSALPTSNLSSQKLSETARSVFCRTQRGNVRYRDVNSIHGLVPYDGSSTFLWIHECVVAHIILERMS
jgi:general transcription factor 3C protein 4